MYRFNRASAFSLANFTFAYKVLAVVVFDSL